MDGALEGPAPRGEHHSEWTPPNSALLVRAGESGASHRVRPLQRGQRTILKMVWASPDCERTDDFYLHLNSLPGLRGGLKQEATAGKGDKGAKGRRGGTSGRGGKRRK